MTLRNETREKQWRHKGDVMQEKWYKHEYTASGVLVLLNLTVMILDHFS